MSDLRLYQCIMVRNRWYTNPGRIVPKGIVVHSSGCNNPQLRRYVNPANGQTAGMGTILPTPTKWSYWDTLRVIGTTEYNNHWNQTGPDYNYGMHAFVGKLADGTIAAVQTLPWDHFLWGCGHGPDGRSYNSSHIQFEICEDTTDGAYTRKSYDMAVQLCAYLCRLYALPVSSITSHIEAHAAGYASNHQDPMHWWQLYGLSMDQFRADVAAVLRADGSPDPVETTVNNLIQDIGINSPDYWRSVLHGTRTPAPAYIQAIFDKYHAAIKK